MSTDFVLAGGGMGRELACGEITKPLIHNMFFTCDFLYAGCRMYRNIMQQSAFQLWCPHILCSDVIILLPNTQLPSFPKVLTNATKCLSRSHWPGSVYWYRSCAANSLPYAQLNMMCISAISTNACHRINELAEQHCHITLHSEQHMFEHNRGGSCGGASARQVWSNTQTVLLFSVVHNSTTKCQMMHIYRLVSFSPSTKHIIMDAVYFRNNLHVLPLTIHVLTYNSQTCT